MDRNWDCRALHQPFPHKILPEVFYLTCSFVPLQIDRSKVDRVNFGEKTVFTIPSNAVVLKVIVIDDQDRLLVAESLDDKYSQLVSILILFTLLRTEGCP